MRLKEKAAKKAILKTRTNMKFDKEVHKYYSSLLGDEKIAALDSFEDLTLEQIGIKLVSTPTNTRKSQILQAALQSMQAGKNGVIGITLADYLFIEKELESDNDEFAAWYMTIAEERQRKVKMEESMQQQQMNAQIQAQAAQQAAEAKAAAQQALEQMKQASIMTEYQQKALLEEIKHNHRMAELAQEGTLEKQKNVEISGNL
jgi:regulator of protease activity HflC (stomatin/prohibitin superfamily)